MSFDALITLGMLNSMGILTTLPSDIGPREPRWSRWSVYRVDHLTSERLNSRVVTLTTLVILVTLLLGKPSKARWQPSTHGHLGNLGCSEGV